MKEDRLVMGRAEIAEAVARLAEAIVERNRGASGLAMVGIKRRGISLARRLASAIGAIDGRTVPVGALDITLYRDDLQLVGDAPVVRGSEIDFDLNGRVVILVDDVLFTGRTVRAALTELVDYGRPQAIQLAVLIDRGHREVPICADYCGKTIATDRVDIVDILVEEEDGEDAVRVRSDRRGQR